MASPFSPAECGDRNCEIANANCELIDGQVRVREANKAVALRIIRFAATLPAGRIGDVIRYQLVKAGTSVGANYREANRAESRNDFIHKIALVEKEGSECQYW